MDSKVMTKRWLCLVTLLCVGSCTHMRTGEVWGREATISPGWQAVKRAGVVAARDPYTWVPAAATAWARIEAGKHFPADVLLGAALGNFVAKFTVEAFLHPALHRRAITTVRPMPGGAAIFFRLETGRSRD